MSTRSGNPKKQGQKHQNAFAFKHNKNSKLTIKIKKSPLDNLCKRCFDILEWKITYRKYKPLTAAAKCNTCLQKTIYLNTLYFFNLKRNINCKYISL